MRLLVALDNHFCRNARGEVFAAPPASTGYEFWQGYLKVFEEVLVLARVRHVNEEVPASVRADGPGVSFSDLPDYLGPWQYLRSFPSLRRCVRQAVKQADAFILRAPATIGQVTWKMIRHRNRAYGIEVIADPWDMFSPGAVPSVVRPLVRRLWTRALRRMCREAPVVSYVTRQVLQERYPPGPRTWSMYASDVDLGRGIASDEKIEARAERLRRLRSSAEPPALCLRLGFLGSFAQLSKGPDVLLRAAAACLKDKLDCEVVLAGEGKFRQTLERLASDLGIMDRVRFLGSLLPGDAVRDFLDQVDLFVLPSRTEGLPRALVEAMARGCPAIGSNVGGIPELLLPEDLVVRDDPRSLAGKIHEVCADPERMIRMSRRNWEGAKGYVPEVVQTRRLEFYRRIRDLAAHAGPDQAAGGGT